MSKPDPEKLRRLAAWTLAWRTAWDEYLAWVQKEYAARLAAFENDRRKARVLLNRTTRTLPLDSQGRVDPTSRKHANGKRRFREQRDAVLAAVVERGLNRFGIQGMYDRTGIFQGRADAALRRLALRRVRDALSEAASAAEKMLEATE